MIEFMAILALIPYVLTGIGVLVIAFLFLFLWIDYLRHDRKSK